ncbi:MAG: hypothetical protein JSS49_22285 [Planctomycetes bacterium]|nr:hypothetical protein [Planctomycetota bacterium]
MAAQRILLLLILVLTVGSTGRCDEPKDDSMQAEVATMAKRLSAECEFTSVGTASLKLEIHPVPLLRWSNPTVGHVFGEVYLWTDNGRPAVVASMYRWFSPKWGDSLEVCSLCESPVTGRKGAVEFWTAKDPGLSLTTLQDVDPPARLPAGRLAQMRRMAADFTANLVDTRSDVAGVRRQLRLLNQPIYRYPTPPKKATYRDGALFTFVEGTDPEVFLILEAFQSDEGGGWRFGLVRMNRDALRVTFRNNAVWSAPFIEDVLNRPREPYAVFSLEQPLKDVGTPQSPKKGSE